MPPAPGRCSTTTGWPRMGPSRSATMRANRSAVPAAENGTTSLIARVGHVSAATAGEIAKPANNKPAHNKPAHNKPAHNKPAHDKPAPNKPAHNLAAHNSATVRSMVSSPWSPHGVRLAYRP